ncbi:MAG TPA: hypothetical protein VG605_04330 [Puia sp.]|jgi:hypothetical protein|nr:hypothetical protein [Puia sp.]
MKSVVKALAVVAAALVVIVSNPLASQANGGSKKASINDEQVSVKYVGTTDNNVVFQVQYENPTGEKFSLIIKNDNGDVVYHQQFSETHFSKNVYIENADTDIAPTFVIRNANNEIVRQFRVVKTVTENTTVTSL